MWSLVWKNRLHSTDPKVQLANKRCRTRVSVWRSTLQQAKAGNGLSAGQNTEKNDMAGLYHGSLAYVSLRRELRSRIQFGEGSVEATAQSFWNWVVQLEGRVSDSSGQKCFVLGCSSFILCNAVNERSLVPGERHGTNEKMDD